MTPEPPDPIEAPERDPVAQPDAIDAPAREPVEQPEPIESARPEPIQQPEPFEAPERPPIEQPEHDAQRPESKPFVDSARVRRVDSPATQQTFWRA